MPNPGSASIRERTKRALSTSSTSTTGDSMPLASANDAIARCSRSTSPS